MQSTARLAVSVLMVTSALTSAYHISPKLRRDGVLSLYPQPRVGRASHYTWDPPLGNDHQNYHDKSSEQEQMEKRQLYAFPRVGRHDPRSARSNGALHFTRDQDPFVRYVRLDAALDDQIEMPLRRTDSPGMWFGPRLGRGFKSDDDDISIERDNNSQNEQERQHR